MNSPAAQYFRSIWPEVMQSWGFTKTAGRIHALLLTEDSPLSMDEIIGALDISRGGVSTQLKVLQTAEMVERLSILGQRQDRFAAVQGAEALQGALIRHWDRTAVAPLLAMQNTLEALTGKRDNPWHPTIHNMFNHM